MNARDDLRQLTAFMAGLRHTIETRLPAAAGALASAREGRASSRAAVASAVDELAQGLPPEVVAGWDDPAWQDQVPAGRPAELRVGAATLAGRGLPATLPVFGVRPLVIASRDRDAAAHAGVVLRNLAVRAAAASGRDVVLHLIDPHQEGFGFPERNLLPNAAVRSANVVADLEAVVEACHAGGAGRPAAVLHLVLALDYPRGYSYGASDALMRIVRLAPAGAQLVLHHDLDAPAGATGRDLDLVDAVVVDVRADGAASGAWGPAAVRLDGPPPRPIVEHIVAAMPDHASAATRIVPWRDLTSADPATWWRDHARDEARAPIGLGADGAPLDITFGMDAAGESHAHTVVGGQAGSGKSVLLHTLITGLATRYSPEELRFYLLDGQDGAEMQVYRDLPHADVVTLRTPDALLRGVLVDVAAELARRNALLVHHGRSFLSELDETSRPPRLLIVIDEYQRLLGGADHSAIDMLQDIAAQGRKVGIHLVLASQRFHATGLLNQDALFANVRTRISLPVAADSLDAIDEFKAEGRRLIAEHCTASGRVVVNDRGGADGANRFGQTAFQSHDDLRALVGDLARQEPRWRPVLIDGAVQPSASANRALGALARTGGRPAALAAWADAAARDGGMAGGQSWHVYDQPFAFVAGRTYSVFGSAGAVVRRADSANVLVVTPDAEVLTGILQTGLVSAALSSPAGALTVSVLGHLPSPLGTSWRGALSTDLVDLLAVRCHTVRVAARPEDALTLLYAAVEEAARRADLSSDDLAGCGPYLVLAAGLERLAPFRMEETRYGPEPSAAGQALRALSQAGPRVGVHLVLGSTSRQAWGQVLPDKAARSFQHRFYQQMSEQDSNALLESLAPSKVTRATGLSGGSGPRGAGYQDAVAGRAVVFMPYVTGPDLTGTLRGLLEEVDDR